MSLKSFNFFFLIGVLSTDKLLNGGYVTTFQKYTVSRNFRLKSKTNLFSVKQTEVSGGTYPALADGVKSQFFCGYAFFSELRRYDINLNKKKRQLFGCFSENDNILFCCIQTEFCFINKIMNNRRVADSD